MRIYWIANGKQCGPATVPDILAKLELGELTPETLGWHSGSGDWRPLRELPALAEYFAAAAKEKAAKEEPPPALPPLPDAPPVDAPLPDKATVILPRPGIRFAARALDMSIYAALVLGIMYTFQVPFHRYLQPGSITFWLPLVLLEACMLHRWGATPGKMIMGIRIRRLSGRMSFQAALKRSMLVFLLGVGCMMPLLSIVMLAMSYFRVKNRGLAVWDLFSTSLPLLVARPSAARKILVAVGIFLCFQLSANYLQPWVPDMLQELREQDPASAQMLEDYLNRWK